MYFRRFPMIYYNFGDNEANTIFPNITAYVDIIDQVKQEVSFYDKYTILDGDRPDTVSQILYDTPDFHWTFFAMNDGLRESGWPLASHKLRALIKKRYPHRTVTTESNIADIFLPGTPVVGKTSGTTGIVIERNLDLGQIVIASDKVGAAYDLIKNNKNGYTFKNNNYLDLSKKILKIYNNKKSKNVKLSSTSEKIIKKWSFNECFVGLTAAINYVLKK